MADTQPQVIQNGGQSRVQGFSYHGIEVPFFVNNNKKWISGIVENTTCGDIIKALLAAEGRLAGLKSEDELDRFVMVEQWRKVERPLKKDAYLLKIWQAWGKDAAEVQFILKRKAGRGNKVKRSDSNSQKKVRRTNSKLIKKLEAWEQKTSGLAASETSDGDSVCGMQGNIKALLKIIISQRETIQTQLGTLKAKDLYLKTLDKSLSCTDGREYVLRNYLEQIPEHVEENLEESQDSGCGSGNDTQDSCNEALTTDHTMGLVVNENSVKGNKDIGEISCSDNSVDKMEKLFEKLYFLNKKLEVQEDDIFRLTIQMDSMLQVQNSGTSGESFLSQEQEHILHSELSHAQEELDNMAKLNNRLGSEIKRNELALSNMMNNYDGRRQFAKRLEHEEQEVINDPSGRKGGKLVGAVVTPSVPDNQLNRIVEEETDWELVGDEVDTDCDNDSESCDEEIKARLIGRRIGSNETFPVLAPPEQFQNCLSPSAQYDNVCGGDMSQYHKSNTHLRAQYDATPRMGGVQSPAYSHTDDSISSNMTSSTAGTEKSVRFSNRDMILSTPEPKPASHHMSWPSGSTPNRTEGYEKDIFLYPAIKVKSILKSETPYTKYNSPIVPDVTSFLLDKEDGTLV